MVKRNPKSKKVIRLKHETLTEPEITTPSIRVGGVVKVNIDLYLKSRKVPLWERGGKKAFALKKGSEFMTEEQFDELFKKY